MNKTIRKMLVLCLVLLLVVVGLVACNKNQNNENPPEEPKNFVEISSEADLIAVAEKISQNTDGYASKVFKVTQDIQLTSEFTPIVNFTGTFDGQFHTISGLDITSENAYVGLFSTLNGATVKNLNVVATSVSNSNPEAVVGILAGAVENATVSCVTVSGNIELGGNRSVAGGIAGSAKNSTFINVKSSATVEGDGSLAGGIIGALNDKAMVVNAYSSATLTASAVDKAKAVGKKTADSAVAYVLVNEGSVVAVEEIKEYIPSYVIGCKSGAQASEMGWNSVDWDVTGATPALKADNNKEHSAPAVTVDGNAVSANYGEVLPSSIKPSADVNNVAVVGYVQGEDAYYESLPLVNDLTLTTVKVDYSDFVGEWIASKAGDANAVVAQALTLGDKNLSRKFAKEENGLLVLFFSDANGDVFRLSVKELSESEKSAGGYAFVQGASLLALEKVNANGYGAPQYFMPSPGQALGAWTMGANCVILTSDIVENGNANAFRSYTVGLSLGTYKTCVKVIESELTVVADGYTVGGDEIPALVKDGVVCEMDVSYYNASWVGEENDIVIEDGKLNGKELSVRSNSFGTGLYDASTDTFYIASGNGINAVKNGQTSVLGKDFSGEWVMYKNGVVHMFNIVGKTVYVDGSSTAVEVSVKYETGVLKLTFTDGTVNYDFSHGGVVLTSNNGGDDYFAKNAVNAFSGVYVLGSQTFTIGNGKVSVKNRNGAPVESNLTINYKNSVITLSAGNMTFAKSNSHMTVKGVETSLATKEDVLTLFTSSELADFYSALEGDWLAPSVAGVKYPYLAMSFNDKVLKLDSNAVNYEFRLENGVITLYAPCVYENSDGVLRILPSENGLLSTYGIGVGKFMPEALADAVGNYYEFLVGSTAQNAKGPKEIQFNSEGGLTLNGVDYESDAYTLTQSNGKFIVTVKETGETVTFNGNKTLLYKGVTYYNYNRVIPTNLDSLTGNALSVDYYQLGALAGAQKFEVVAGHLGSYQVVDEEDGETVWVAPVYPLYGFRYTDADGNKYISESYSWIRNNDVVTLYVSVLGADNAKAEVVVTYPYGCDFSVLEVKFANEDAITVYSANYISELVCTYVNNHSSFVVRADGTLWINGVNKTYSYNVDGNVQTFTVDGVEYVIDNATPEIANCGGEVLYDARFAHLAGVKLVSFTRGDAVADRDHTLILTSDGFFFDNEKVQWKNYSRSTNEILFIVKDMVEGVETDITWKLETSGSVSSIAPFGLQFYPNYNFSYGTDWNQRWFVPEILLDASFYMYEDTSVSVIQPDYSSGGFVPFVIYVNDDQYGYNDYMFSFENGVLTVDLEDHVLTFAYVSGEIEVTLDGQLMQSNVELPPLSDYLMDNQPIYGCERAIDVLTVTENMIIYNPDGGEYGRKEVTTYTFGKWNGYDVIYFTAGNEKYALIKTDDGKVFAVIVELFSLLGSYNIDGQGVVASLDFSGDAPQIKIVHGSADVTDVKYDSRMMYTIAEKNSRSALHISYVANGKRYFITCDYATSTGNVIAPEELFYLTTCSNNDLDNSHRLYATLGKDINGNAVLKYTVCYSYTGGTHVEVELVPVPGKANVYSVTYNDQSQPGVAHTTFFGMLPSDDSSEVIEVLKEEQLAFVGWNGIASTGKNISFEIGVANTYENTRKLIGIVVSYDGAVPVLLEKDFKSDCWMFDATVDGNVVKYYVKLNDNDEVILAELTADMKAFLSSSSYAGFYLVGESSYAVVKFDTDGFNVTFKFGATENVVYDALNKTLSFVHNGQKYYIVIIDASQDYEYYRGCTVTESQYNFMGMWQLDGGKTLQVSAVAQYLQASLSVAYDGQAVSEVVIQSENVMTFKLGDIYYGAYLKDGKMYVSENILDTHALEYALLGTYADRNVKIAYKAEVKNVDGTEKVVASYSVTQNGTEVEYTIDEKTLVLTLGEKYYGVCTGSTKGLKEFTAGELALFGEYSVGDDTVVLIPNCTATVSRGVYTYSVNYSLKLNGNVATDVKMSNDDSATPKSYVQFKCDGKTYLFFVITAGENAVLHELTDEQVGMFGVNTYISDEGGYRYLKSAIEFDEEGNFTQTLKFENEPITEMTVIEGFGYSFKSAGVTTNGKVYYVAEGSSKYILFPYEYAWYTDTVTVNGHTVKVTAGASSSYKYQVSIDGADAVNGTYKTSGEYGYIQFTSGGNTYILTRNTENENAWVLTQLTAEQSAAMAAGGYSVKLLDANNEPYYSSKTSLSQSVAVNAKGEVSVGWMYGDYAVSKVEIVNNFDSALFINSALIVTINGHKSYVLIHGSYSAYLTEEQYALIGKWTVGSGDDAKELLVGLYESAGWMCLQVTYGGVKSDKGHDGYLDCTFNGGSTDFATIEVGGAEYTAIKFTVGGKTYYAYLDTSGKMQVVEK